ncbi:hypothetical protein, partial [Immundisolibacter sp.]|uniref:hypothetical protein n=1 Tax=Immundisolibacter sp. TaxID=1934948 RepID=UPI00356B2493
MNFEAQVSKGLPRACAQGSGALRRVDFAQADPDLLVILQHGERIAIGDAGSAAGRVAAKLRVAVNT